jgi:hypothetical protein
MLSRLGDSLHLLFRARHAQRFLDVWSWVQAARASHKARTAGSVVLGGDRLVQVQRAPTDQAGAVADWQRGQRCDGAAADLFAVAVVMGAVQTRDSRRLPNSLI